jgi:hypothetical protein
VQIAEFKPQFNSTHKKPLKSQQQSKHKVTSVGEDVKKLEFLCTDDGNLK